MKLKIFFLVLIVCFAQTYGRNELFMSSPPPSVESDYETLPPAINEDLGDLYDLSPNIMYPFVLLEPKFHVPPRKHVADCYAKESTTYMNLTKTFAQGVNKISKDFRSGLLKNHKKKTKRARKALDMIAKLTNGLGHKMKNFIANLQFFNAMKYVEETSKTLEDNEYDFARGMKEVRLLDPKYVEGTENRLRRLRDDVKIRNKALTQRFENCINNADSL